MDAFDAVILIGTIGLLVAFVFSAALQYGLI